MFIIPVNTNIIYVDMIEDGWLESKFDTTYPLQLRGIISESEYQESIDKINNSMKINKAATIFWTLLMITVVGMICSLIALLHIKSKRMERLKQSITEESAKYSSRSPTPCRWRLDFEKYLAPGRTPLTTYHLAIDIDYAAASENGSGTHSLTQNDNGPPPYSTQSAGFCTHCGTARQDVTAKFCSSCGQAFN